MIDLCKIFGVEEGEEFKIKNTGWNEKLIFKIQDNVLLRRFENDIVSDESYLKTNLIINAEVIKLPKKKEFTDDELAIMRSLPKEYKWMARDKVTYIVHTFVNKPKKSEYKTWESEGYCCFLSVFSHVFNSIQWEDEEPVFIDDYVERGTE